MNELYCIITGREANTMRIKLFLRLFFFIILALTKVFFGMDWAFVVGLVVIVGDLDEIADLLKRKFGRKC